MSTIRSKKHSFAGSRLTDIILEIFKTNLALLSAGTEITHDSGLSSVRWQIMAAVRDGGKTAAQIGRELGMSRQITLWNAQFLADQGYITFEDNPGHRRAGLIVLTPHGESTLAEITRNQIAWSNSLAQHFEPDELDATLKVLTALREHLR
ncbi:MarR family winged helix-turn-helix transcriptional regulator [Burkholderia gladioli pv. gladioli]|uniref:MarR family protein n=1 Tax=Burkholderia gladioli TaxID=28095 RepID=A0A095F2S5_BURGA|nr:MarR family winged helix-turn-helix transcriptional regulator [Burkholderia gladioli]AJW97582.1 marR family protein [Burkholderia gladioli]ASD79971.1 MarR family transcriptional regulator [Burkholderia gladioli pv. gladioli]AWY54783.1 MarR family transcriptional regulator [Burkholderia gladioli pv. gladioli]KGC11623.1 marR family protein [Burkholderia gladioli]MDJ1164229.1 MarR family winged helix-turn-helix transcriptional regulator [Burkholderia gladioli pv. gladioli]